MSRPDPFGAVVAAAVALLAAFALGVLFGALLVAS